MDRAPGLSVRLKLTLSYAGFLMLAGVLMLAAVWVVVLRYIPDGALYHMHPSWWFVVNRSDPLHGFGSVAAMRVASVMRVRGASMRPARIHPPSRPNTSRNAITMVAVGYVPQQEHPHRREQQDTGNHEEPGVAEGEFEANAQARGSIHCLLPHALCLVAYRCGSRHRPR